MAGESKGLLKNSAIVAVASGLGVLGGFIQDAAVAAVFGIGVITDAFYAAYVMPSVVVSILSTAYGFTLVPVVSRLLAQEDREGKKAWYLVSNILNASFICVALLLLVGLPSMPVLIRLAAPGFDPRTTAMAVQAGYILILTLPLANLIEINRAILYTHRHFVIPASMNAIRAFVAAAFVLLAPRSWGVLAVAFAFALGMLCQAILSGLSVFLSCKPHYHLSLNLGDPVVRQTGRLFLAPLAQVSFRQSITLAMRVIGSFLPAGSVTALSYADRLVFAVGGLLLNSVVTATLPILSSELGKQDRRAMGKLVSSALRLSMMLAVPVGTVFVVLGTPLIQVFFRRGAFDLEAVTLTGGILTFFGLGLPALGVFRGSTGYLYAAMEASKVIFLFFLQALTTILFDLVLVGRMGAKGLALGFTAGTTVAAATGLYMISKRREDMSLWKFGIFCAKLLVSAFPMAIALWSYHWLESSLGSDSLPIRLLCLGVVLGLGSFLFLVTAIRMQMEEAMLLYVWVKRKVIFLGGQSLASRFSGDK
jgi:putative peptidoglycan lipid II flippase